MKGQGSTAIRVKPAPRGSFAVVRQLLQAAAYFDRAGDFDAPINLPTSFDALSRLSLRPGPEPRTFMHGRHVVRAAW